MLQTAVSKSRKCDEKQFSSPEHVDMVPANPASSNPDDINMQLVQTGRINVYSAAGNPEPVQSEAKLTDVLFELAQTFGCSTKSVNIFREKDSKRIAFNRSGSFFFNSCYLPPNSVSGLEFYYTVFAHELAHNDAESHGAAHTSLMEGLIQATLTKFTQLNGHSSRN